MKFPITQKYNGKVAGTQFTGKQLRDLIYPLIIEQILAVTVGMVDTMMISAAGEAAMSGVSLVDMVNNLLISIFAAIATGGAVVISQYLGSTDLREASKAAAQLVNVAALIGFGLGLLSVLFKVPLLQLLFGSIEADVMESALIYFMISAFSYPFMAVYNASAAIFRSMGDSKISMIVSAGMNIFNAIGNAILIFGFHMGAAGAALSTLAARVLGALVLTAYVVYGKRQVTFAWKNLLSWDGQMVFRILHIAIPSGIENGIFQLGRVLVVSIIALFGTAQIAANAVANSLDSMGCIIGQAMNLAMITVVGQCMGAGDKEQAIHYTKKLWKWTYLMTAVSNFFILAFLHQILNFYSLSPEAYRYSYILVMIHDGLAILMWPTAFTMPNALRAAGDVKYCMIVSTFSMFMFRIVFSVILGIGLGWGAIGVWIAMIIDWVFRVILLVWRYLSGKWLEYKVI